MESRLPKPSLLLKPSGFTGSIQSGVKLPTKISGMRPATSMLTLHDDKSYASGRHQPIREPLNVLQEQVSRSVAPRPVGRAAMRRSKSCAEIKKYIRSDIKHTQPVAFKRPVIPATAAKRAAVQPIISEHTAPKITKTAKIPSYDFKARYNDLLEKHKVMKAELSRLKEMEPAYIAMKLEYDNNTRDLRSAVTNITQLKDTLTVEQAKIKDLSEKLNESSKNIKLLTEDNTTLTQKLSAVTVQNSTITTELKLYKEASADQKAQIDQLSEETKEFRKMVYNSNIERKQLHNQIQDLKGNIRVFCRVRPTILMERNKSLCNIAYMDEKTLEITKSEDVTSSTGGKTRCNKLEFAFDQVFPPACSQDELFMSVSPLVQSALDGFNICIFAYGQTGSGKTYTMEGTSRSERGVIPRTVELTFNTIKDMKSFGWSYTVTASFLEIYNEHVYDLLDPNQQQSDHDIRMTDSKGTDVYVTNLKQEDVKSCSELLALLDNARSNRATAATQSNDRSSRSHMVTKIKIIGKHKETNETLTGSINLVDLAGSESPKHSTRMTETKNINKSLAELGKVILSLQQRQEHIPYRNSRLTFLLSPCLGGNSKTLMFVNVSPVADCQAETLSSLRFAQRVNQVKSGKVKRLREYGSLTQIAP